MRTRSPWVYVFAFGLGSAACKESPPTGASSSLAANAPPPPPATPAPTVASADDASTPARDGDASLPDVGGVLTLAWKVANAANENVTVSLVAAERTLPVGPLNAAADDAAGTVATCAMKNRGATASDLVCGGTPAYNFFTARLADGALVITLTTGIDGEPASERVKEVARHRTSATSLKVTGPAPPGLYGNCRPGFVQRTADGPCLRQCLKSACKGKDTCQMIAVAGLDGPHRVSACVPPGK